MPELDLGSYGQNSEHGHKSSHKHWDARQPPAEFKL
jgi:hypothetical protein